MKRILLSLICCLFFYNAIAETPELAVTCAACHGENGISPNTDWPNLAGQQQGYLVKEITAFRDERRVETAMPAVLLEGVSDEQIEELATYYSTLPKVQPSMSSDTSAGLNVRAGCVSCHGMDGITVSPMWANLAGQKEGYLRKQLMDYKSGHREHLIMQVIANELTDQQIIDVAKYYSEN